MELFSNEIFLFLKEFSQGNIYLIIIFIIILQIFSAIFFMPCSYIPILSGGLLGFEIGGVIALIAQCCGSNITFYLGNYFNKNSFLYKFKTFNKIQKNMNKNFLKLTSSWKNIFIFYFNPLLPGSSMGYFFGLSRAKRFSFFYKALLSSFPGCFIPAGFGAGIIDQLAYGQTSFLLKMIICSFIFLIIIISLYKRFKNSSYISD